MIAKKLKLTYSEVNAHVRSIATRTTRSNCRGWRLCSSYPSRGQAARLLSALLPYYVERTLHPACHVLDPDSTAY